MDRQRRVGTRCWRGPYPASSLGGDSQSGARPRRRGGGKMCSELVCVWRSSPSGRGPFLLAQQSDRRWPTVGGAGLGPGASLPRWSAEGAGGRSWDSGPPSPFPLSESSAWHGGSQAGRAAPVTAQKPRDAGLGWGGGVTWAAGALPAPSPRLQPNPPCSCCPLSLWPLGKTLQAAG